MNPFRNDNGTLNEILFENRNKSYGSYVMRKSYNSTVLKSLLVTAGFFIIGFYGLSLLVNTKEELKFDTGTTTAIEKTIVYEAKKQKTVIPVVNKQTAASGSSVKALVGTVIKDTVAKAIVTVMNNLITVSTSSLNTTGIIPGTGTTTVNVIPTNTLNINGGGEVEFAPDVMPEFKDLAKFIQDNLNYPYAARENYITGKVGVNFIIDEEGKIVSTKLLRGIGYGCDEEALRVIKLMPKWKPGMKDGKPVKVSFNLPIVFKLR